MTFLLANWRVLAFAAVVLILSIQTWRLDRCQSQFEEFRISTEAIARAQAAKNAAILESNEQIAREVVKGKNDAIIGLSQKYDRARRELAAARRLRDNPGGGGVPAQPEARPLASACPDPGAGSVAGDQAAQSRLERVEAELLDLLQRLDEEQAKYAALWRWSQGVR